MFHHRDGVVCCDDFPLMRVSENRPDNPTTPKNSIWLPIKPQHCEASIGNLDNLCSIYPLHNQLTTHVFHSASFLWTFLFFPGFSWCCKVAVDLFIRNDHLFFPWFGNQVIGSPLLTSLICEIFKSCNFMFKVKPDISRFLEKKKKECVDVIWYQKTGDGRVCSVKHSMDVT